MEEKLLDTFKIVLSPQRIEILRLILRRRGKFTVNDLKDGIKPLSVAISDATLVTTIQLFHTRHLLVGSPSVHSDKGRPPMQYELSVKVRDILEPGN